MLPSSEGLSVLLHLKMAPLHQYHSDKRNTVCVSYFPKTFYITGEMKAHIIEKLNPLRSAVLGLVPGLGPFGAHLPISLQRLSC